MKIILLSLLFVFLTVITQIGGIVMIVVVILVPRLGRTWILRWPIFSYSVAFLLLYGLVSAFVVPPLARLNDRIPLPVSRNGSLVPLTIWTVLLNRHYVDPELARMMSEVASANVDEGESPIQYLDACFPFIDGFPLPPHLSHNDGRKLDLTFCYHSSDRKIASPSAIGYGAFEPTHEGEDDTAAKCLEQGAWWYDILGIIPISDQIELDQQRTRDLEIALARHSLCGKLFLEPYLKERWNIRDPKVRFHGCHAVSHAVHIHVHL